MTHSFTPDITFLLGPPTEPTLRARFEEAQQGSPPVKSPAERGAQLEPRLPALLVERSGGSSVLSSTFSFVLGAPVRVVVPFLGWGCWKGQYVATLQLYPRHVEGPAHAVARLFADGEAAISVANVLGLVLKLDWVYSVRTVARLPRTGAPAAEDPAGRG